jgi:hypothetical protein
VSCALAVLLAARDHPTWLVDLAGDVPAALGVAEPGGPGIRDWIASASAAPTAVDALGTVAADNLRLVSRGGAEVAADSARWAEIGAHLAQRADHTVVDAGTGPPPAGLLAAAQERLLVTRACYLGLRRAAAADAQPTGVIVVLEPGRALRPADVSYAVHAPVVAEIMLDPAISRAVDAGLLVARLPRTLGRSLDELLP